LLESGPGRIPRAVPPRVQLHAQPDQVFQRRADGPGERPANTGITSG
jgi:hypothetical protein